MCANSFLLYLERLQSGDCDQPSGYAGRERGGELGDDTHGDVGDSHCTIVNSPRDQLCGSEGGQYEQLESTACEHRLRTHAIV